MTEFGSVAAITTDLERMSGKGWCADWQLVWLPKSIAAVDRNWPTPPMWHRARHTIHLRWTSGLDGSCRSRRSKRTIS